MGKGFITGTQRDSFDLEPLYKLEAGLNLAINSVLSQKQNVPLAGTEYLKAVAKNKNEHRAEMLKLVLFLEKNDPSKNKNSPLTMANYKSLKDILKGTLATNQKIEHYIEEITQKNLSEQKMNHRKLKH